MDKKLELSLDLANKITGYLGTRPYQEVFYLITALQEAAKEQGLVAPQEEPKSEE
jgi:hypothetical protein